MNRRKTTRTVEDFTSLWLDLQELEDGTLDPVRRDELMALLEHSPAARRSYLEYFHQTAALRMEAAKMLETGLIPFVGSRQQEFRMFRRALVVAAAVLVMAALVAGLISIRYNQPERMTAAVAAGTLWSVDGERRGHGEDQTLVTSGSEVRVLSGSLELRLDSGAVMLMQGPARAKFGSMNRLVLHHGWIWIESEDSDESFSVETPNLHVRDIGTRFGVRVEEDGSAEVHLLDGILEIVPKKPAARATRIKPTGKGIRYPLAGDAVEKRLADDPFPLLSELIQRPAGYRTTLLSQSPVGYWKLDTPLAGDLPNEVPGGQIGGCSAKITLDPEAVAQGLPGFGAGNRAARLTGDYNQSVLYDLGSHHGVSMKEGAVSFWIRRPPGALQTEALWLAGVSDSGNPSPNRAPIHTQLTSSGTVLLVIDNGDAALALSSSTDIRDGKWHHVVASWGLSAVELHVDGVIVARDTGKRNLDEGKSFGRYVRFGKPSIGHKIAGVQAFNGWVDEIALWNRELTPSEVAHQYRAAWGESQD